MKRVILLRHAKSSWKDPSLDDHDRPLNRRGKAAAPVIGAWLAERGYGPDTVLCSSSLRTRQTVQRLRKTMPDLPEATIEEFLYHALPDVMLERLRQLPKTCETVMMVGHQPGLSALTRKLADGTEEPRCSRAYEHFPTAAAAVLELELNVWSELGENSARFVDFAKPRELMDT